MKAKISDLTLDISTRKQRLTLELDGDFRREYDELNGKDLEMTLKPYRKKRTLNANAYAWELIHRLAERMNLPDVEIYRNAIRRVGIYKDFTYTVDDANTWATAWSMLGLGWITERLDYDEDPERIVLRCYYGSSVYNTQQMARLIDDIVADCKELGIETMTPAEQSRLIANWHRKEIEKCSTES